MSWITFIGTPEKMDGNKCTDTLLNLFYVAPNDVICRIFTSFVPPLSKRFCTVYVDLQGPLMALLLLIVCVNYGYSLKLTQTFWLPTETVLIYSLCMPLLCFMLCKLGHSHVNLWETTAVIGYGLYGHVVTLCVAFLCPDEHSSFWFFICLIAFGGLSTLRITLIVLGTLTIPAARLLICTVIAVVNILFLTFLHFAYMHRTFSYRAHAEVSN